jgi:hypothetical protein
VAAPVGERTSPSLVPLSCCLALFPGKSFPGTNLVISQKIEPAMRA